MAPARERKATVDVDILVEAGDWPDEDILRSLAADALSAVCAELALKSKTPSELSIVFTDDDHVRQLNAGWRGKDKPTNVLSFPAFEVRPGAPLPPMLGDIVLAAETIAGEAALEGKPTLHHITHLLVHGFLHLIGHDHEENVQAQEMEELERRILARLAIPDPYA